MKRINHLLILTTLLIGTGSFAKDYKQQKDINELVKEMTYLINVTERLKRKYRNDNSKIRFNYDALIEQLRVAKKGTQEYLRQDLYELHTAPPVPVIRNQTKVRP